MEVPVDNIIWVERLFAARAVPSSASGWNAPCAETAERYSGLVHRAPNTLVVVSMWLMSLKRRERI